VAAFNGIVASPPVELAGRAVVSTEQPADDILVLHLDGDARVIVRPSGTEPKLKIYLQVVIDDFDAYDTATAQCDEALDALQREALDALGLPPGG